MSSRDAPTESLKPIAEPFSPRPVLRSRPSSRQPIADNVPGKGRRRWRPSRDSASVVAGVVLLVVMLLLLVSRLGESSQAVAVAAVDIARGTRLDASMLKTVQVNVSHTSGFLTIDQAMSGMSVMADLKEGMPVMAYALADQQTVSHDKQTFAISLPVENFVNGDVNVGDSIDVFVTRHSISDERVIEGAWIAEGLRVVASRSSGEAAGAQSTRGQLSLVVEAEPDVVAAVQTGRVAGGDSGSFVAKSTGMPTGHVQLFNWTSLMSSRER